MRRAGCAIGLAMLVWAACGVARAQSYATMASEPDQRDFVQRADTGLTVAGRPLRFGGVDITWLGLRRDGAGQDRRPTAYEVQDALSTAIALGASVIRVPGLAATAHCALCLETSPGQMNAGVFAQIDLVLKTARDMGLKVILPLADSGRDCTGSGSAGVICAAAPAPGSFFTDAHLGAAFALRVKAILTHVNSLTGATYTNDPTILAWEDCDACAASSGNDQAVSAWSERLGQIVKASDHHHLYESGAFAGRIGPGSTAPVAAALYAPPGVDIIGDHPVIGGDAANVRRVFAELVDTAARSGRVYVLDSFGWSPALWHTEADFEAWLADIVRERLLAGAMVGNLQGHADTGGYLPAPPPAGQGVAALYFPGYATADMDLATMQERGRALRRFNFAMVDVTLAPSYLLTPEPEILSVKQGRIVWRGAAGAANYEVERSPDPSEPGTWTTLCSACATDATGTWTDPAPPASPAWYRMMPLNINGHRSVPSLPVRAQ